MQYKRNEPFHITTTSYELLKNADKALYKAKESGKRSYRVL